jgi:hypothetical protein
MKTSNNQSPATGRHAPAQGAAAKRNKKELTPWQALSAQTRKPHRPYRPQKPRVAKIDVMRSTNNGLETIEKYSCEYYSKARLFRHIHDYFCGGEYPELPDELRITLANDLWFFWNFSLAHYCFAKGRMTEDEFILATIESLGKTPDFVHNNSRRAAV